MPTCACATAYDIVYRMKTAPVVVSDRRSGRRVSCAGITRTVARGAGMVVPISVTNVLYSCSGLCRVVRDGGRLFSTGGRLRRTFNEVVILTSYTRNFKTIRGGGATKALTSFAYFSFRTIGGLAATRKNTMA